MEENNILTLRYGHNLTYNQGQFFLLLNVVEVMTPIEWFNTIMWENNIPTFNNVTVIHNKRITIIVTNLQLQLPS
jgi:hypothetical protein